MRFNLFQKNCIFLLASIMFASGCATTTLKYLPSHFERNESLEWKLRGRDLTLHLKNGEVFNGRFQTVIEDSLVFSPDNYKILEMRIALQDMKHLSETRATHLEAPILTIGLFVLVLLSAKGFGDVLEGMGR